MWLISCTSRKRSVALSYSPNQWLQYSNGELRGKHYLRNSGSLVSHFDECLCHCESLFIG